MHDSYNIVQLKRPHHCDFEIRPFGYQAAAHYLIMDTSRTHYHMFCRLYHIIISLLVCCFLFSHAVNSHMLCVLLACLTCCGTVVKQALATDWRRSQRTWRSYGHFRDIFHFAWGTQNEVQLTYVPPCQVPQNGLCTATCHILNLWLHDYMCAKSLLVRWSRLLNSDHP